MSWADLPEGFREIAERVLTERELVALKLREGGTPYRRIAERLGVEVGTAYDTVKRAERKVMRGMGVEA